jgi:hypothetical protein
MRTKIRKTILEKLRPEKKLSRRDPGEEAVRFVVHWDPLRFFEEQGYNAPPEDVLELAVTVTGHANDVQVATCMDYIAQTWPETGPALLKFLKAAIKTVCRDRGSWWSGEKPPFSNFTG